MLSAIKDMEQLDLWYTVMWECELGHHPEKLEDSTKTKCMPILWPDPVVPQINDCVCAPKDMYKNANSSPIENNKMLQKSQRSIKVRMGKNCGKLMQ